MENSPTVASAPFRPRVIVPECSIVPPKGVKGTGAKLKSVSSVMAKPTWKFSEKGVASVSVPTRVNPAASSNRGKSKKTLVTPDSTPKAAFSPPSLMLKLTLAALLSTSYCSPLGSSKVKVSNPSVGPSSNTDKVMEA